MLLPTSLVLAACTSELSSTPTNGIEAKATRTVSLVVSSPTNTSVPHEEGLRLTLTPTSTASDLPAVEESADATGIPEGGTEIVTRTRKIDGMQMVYVPPGAFQMGSSWEQLEGIALLCEQYPDAWNKCQPEQFEREYPQHTVTLDGYWIDRNEVTNAQYNLCVQAGDCGPSRIANDAKYKGAGFPAAGIPWKDALDYCTWAGVRLPSEAEWEVAARGPQGLIYPWGDEFVCEGGNLLDESTGCGDGYAGPSPVGSFPQGVSWVGAWDMAGNVWEWVADEFSAYPGANDAVSNAVTSTDTRILRGGSWGYTPAFVRAAYRYPVPPEADYAAVGFRCAVSEGE